MTNELLFETEIFDLRISVIADRPSYRLVDHSAIEMTESALMGLHQHSFYELFFVPDDSIKIVTEERTEVYNNKAVIIPPRFNHYVKSWAKSGYCLIFAIEGTTKGDGIAESLSAGISSFDIDEDMLFYMERLSDMISCGSTGEEASHLCALLFISFFKKLELTVEKSTVSSLKYRNYVNILDQYISRHYAEQIRIDDVARELHLCSKQVSRIVNKEYGMSLSRVIHRHRLSVACMLLKHTSLSITQIADNVGYEYENYFFRMFKDTYGITPTEYREREGK